MIQLKSKMKNIKITSITLAMLIVTMLVATLSIYGLVRLSSNYNEMLDATDQYLSGQQAISDMQEASLYLTDQCRQYVLTGNRENMNNYIYEVYESKRRQNALNQIKESVGQETGEAVLQFERALVRSDSLLETELYAIRLISDWYGYDLDSLPEPIIDVTLSKEDEGLNFAQKRDKAYKLVLGKDYIDARNQIMDNLLDGSDKLITYMDTKQLQLRLNMKISMLCQVLYFAILVITILVVFVLIYVLVIRTITQYAENIEAGEKMDDKKGTSEFQSLAKAYNKLSEKNNLQKLQLEYQANHDALTGLLNRNAFNTVSAYLEENEKEIALLIIDVDRFKEINDAFGHEMGDRSLKRVATLLQELFRTNDYLIRYGGDEFMVIMTGIKEEQKFIIARKIEEMNRDLLDGRAQMMPEFSVSVGVAFSPYGYSEELFNHADEMLYEVKQNGRCGFKIYEY